MGAASSKILGGSKSKSRSTSQLAIEAAPSADAAPDAATKAAPTAPAEAACFPPILIDPDVQAALPDGYVIRPLEAADFDKGYLQLLAELTEVGSIERDAFNERFAYFQKHNDTYCPLVIEDTNVGKVVGAGTVVIEHKFLHELGKVGHIEDIVVDANQRGKKLGLRVIAALVFISKQLGSYKTILNCSEGNIGFYEKCGFTKKEVEMVMYHNKS
ncbi:Glucosamine-phosphate N-acetyltransferase-like protein [Allomyces javanicus]|nr:Glucosamine-phosphate N-acetyltransferase-like protein [Allomyces javanicus]